MDNSLKEVYELFSETESKQLELFYALLIDWNRRINLTSVTEKHEVFIKHFLDSVLIGHLHEWRKIQMLHGRVVDIGTGAGFPGIPLAIRHPEITFTLCDALAKRIQFLNVVVSELGLKNVVLVHQRAEDLGQDKTFRHQFHGSVSRAVARLNILLEFMCPLVMVGGISFAFKGPVVFDEIPDGERCAAVVGAKIQNVYKRTLPDGAGERTIVVVEQMKETPKKYPRKAGTPQRKPL